MRKLFITSTALLLFTSPVFAGTDLDAAEKDVCRCLEAPQNQAMKMMELFDKAQASGDMSELQAAQDEMQGIIEESGRCFAALPEKYPEIDKSEELQKEVMANAARQCPDPVSQVSMKQ
jgi:hypothetical protein